MMFIAQFILMMPFAAEAEEKVPPVDKHPDSQKWDLLFKDDLSNADFRKATWKMEKGVLSAQEMKPLWTGKKYGDFVLDFEFMNSEGTNSGIIVRSSVLKGRPSYIEVQILDDHSPHYKKSKTMRSGSFVGLQAAEKSLVKKAGEWNRMTITCQSRTIHVVLNGEKVNEMDMSKWTSTKTDPDGGTHSQPLYQPIAQFPFMSPIGFQGRESGMPISFRNIRIRQIENREGATEERVAKLFLIAGDEHAISRDVKRELGKDFAAPFPKVKAWLMMHSKNTGRRGAWLDVNPVPPGAGVEVSFAHAIAEMMPDEDIRLIRYMTLRGRLSDSWAPRTGKAYNTFLETVRAALADLEKSHRKYEIVGMLWIQGEGDLRARDTKEYERNLVRFIANIRKECATPQMPFLISRLPSGKRGNSRNHEDIRAAQMKVGKSDRRAAWIDVDDLPRTSAQYVPLGTRFAEAYKGVLEKK